ncbi:MAG: LysM peptidoglycan-binding domain-containing protein [Candidatus Riflebacteria bacterium]|nr:LysM peptidoglycan-binding domain-containing protein [Candidatus Riflebacteria bacterium]
MRRVHLRSLVLISLAVGLWFPLAGHSQNMEEILGIGSGNTAQGPVVRQTVSTSGQDTGDAAVIRAEINALLDEINKLLEEIGKALKDTAGTVTGKAKEAADKAKDKVKETADKVKDKVKETADKVKDKVTGSSSTTYTVRQGDSLWAIAQRLLGNGNRWPEIVEANKSRYPSLAKNPNLIYAGWKLTIPGARSTTGPSTTTPPPTSGTTPPSSSSGESAALNAWKGGKLAPSEFCRLLGPVARESMKVTGVPASVTLAQAALETGWGRATIGDAKNLFGIKGTGPAGSITVKTQEYINGRYVTVNGTFRKYHTWRESIDDHARLLTTASRYRNCMANKSNPDQFARELQKAGYATSPTYASTLISIMKQYNLYQYDK